MWVISHPDAVTEPECAAYTQVFAASSHWASTVSRRWGFPVEPLLQCTDAEIFRPDAATPDTAPDVVFVGNSRKVQRLSVKYAIDAGMAPMVYGGGWRGVIPEARIAAEYVPNGSCLRCTPRPAWCWPTTGTTCGTRGSSPTGCSTCWRAVDACSVMTWSASRRCSGPGYRFSARRRTSACGVRRRLAQQVARPGGTAGAGRDGARRAFLRTRARTLLDVALRNVVLPPRG